MTLTFIETVSFTSALSEHFGSDEEYRKFQEALLKSPDSGDVIRGAGGLRKFRWRDSSRGKGSRGGIRIIYLHVPEAQTILLLAMYGKDRVADLTADQGKVLASLAGTFRAELRCTRLCGKNDGN